MQIFQQTIKKDLLNEINTLSENQLSSVLEYVRFLKIKTLSGKQIEDRFDSALEEALEHRNIKSEEYLL